MSYTNFEDRRCEAAQMPVVPEPPMAELMKEISLLAEQNNGLANRIRAFLTGCQEEGNERAKEPGCFREELLKARYETRRTNELLGMLAVELGLP